MSLVKAGSREGVIDERLAAMLDCVVGASKKLLSKILHKSTGSG